MAEPLRIWWNKNLHGKISPGKLAAHAAHAALRAYGIEYDHPIVVLAAGKGRIEDMPITVHDEGRTELEPGTLTTGVDTTAFTAWLAEHDREKWRAGYSAGNLDGYFGTRDKWREHGEAD